MIQYYSLKNLNMYFDNLKNSFKRIEDNCIYYSNIQNDNKTS